MRFVTRNFLAKEIPGCVDASVRLTALFQPVFQRRIAVGFWLVRRL